MSKRHKYPMYWDGTQVPDHVNFIVKREGIKPIGVSRRSGRSQVSVRLKSGKWVKIYTSDQVQTLLNGITVHDDLLWSRSDYEPPISADKLNLFLRTFRTDSAWLAEEYDWYEDSDKYLTVKIDHENANHTLFDFNRKGYQPPFASPWVYEEICHVSEVQGLLDYLGIDLQAYAPREEGEEEDIDEFI